MEPESLLACSQKLTIKPYPEAVESNPYLHTLYSEELTNQEANSCAASENS
jgi:hypothetical protein